MHLLPRLLPLIALGACGAHAAATTEPAQAAPSSQPGSASPARAAAPDPRELSGEAHFADLVRLASELDSSGQAHSESGCLLRGTEPIRFEADLSLSMRPLPPVPEHANETVPAQTGSVTVISPWGTVRGDLPDTIVLPFTTTSPDAVKHPTVALFATGAGVYLRGGPSQLALPTTALSPDAAGAWLARLTQPTTVYVTADRALTLRKLVELLKLIPNQHEVALSVALPQGTRLPAPASDTGEGLCANGLPEPAPGEAEGELDPAAAQRALSPLREAALSCALSTGGRAVLGGKLVLALRIGQDGRAREACFVSDAIAEPLLRRCLLSNVRGLVLPRPSPAGFADLHIPLQLQFAGPKPQRASCD